jgi:hypothetical protein
MRTFLLLALFNMAACICVFAQSPQDVLNRAREIKLFESDRHDVRQILYDLEATDDDGRFQRFSNDKFDIEVTYASGTCSEDVDEEEDAESWKVEEWKVVKIEITLDASVTPKDLGFDLSKFTKEQEFANDTNEHIYHNKARGMAFKINEDRIDTIIFFPPDKRTKQLLCDNNAFFKAFYSRKSWFSEPLEDRGSVCINPIANVTVLSLDKTVIDATSSKIVRIETVANDPDNDPLVFNYTVSAGRINGTGAKVVWDLTGVPAGTYTITAGVDDGCGICGQTVTKTITVK